MKNSRYVRSPIPKRDSAEIVIIVLNWNGLSIKYKNQPILYLCLKSVFNLKYPNLKLIVVDAESKDGSLQYLNSKFRNKLDVITSKNIGWAHNNNVGIKYALKAHPHAKYIFLMSNDIILTDKNWLNKFTTILPNDSSVGVIGCKLLNVDRTIQNSGLFLNKFGYLDVHKSNRRDGYFTKNEYIVGAFIIIAADCFRTVGYLDETYIRMGAEDTDFQERARQNGYNIFYMGSLNAMHLESASTFKLKKEITNRWNTDQLHSDMNRNHYLFLLRYHKFKFISYLIYDFIKSFIGIKPHIYIRNVRAIKKNLKNLNIEINDARIAYDKVSNYGV